MELTAANNIYSLTLVNIAQSHFSLNLFPAVDLGRAGSWSSFILQHERRVFRWVCVRWQAQAYKLLGCCRHHNLPCQGY